MQLTLLKNYKKLSKIKNFKRYIIGFISLFSFASAVGIFFSIYNSADSNPRSVIFFLSLGFMSLVILVSVILSEIYRLYANFRNQRAGSKLQTKIVAVFSIIAIIPVLIVAIFAVIFFERGIEDWFSKRVETALEKSAAIAENYNNETKRRIEGDALYIGVKLSNFNQINFSNRLQLEFILNNLASERGVNELALITTDGNIISASKNSFFLPKIIEPNEFFASILNDNSPVAFVKTNNNIISVITPVIGHIGLYLYVSRYLDPVIIYNLKSVRESINDYTRAKRESDGAKVTFTMVFLAVALILLLLAVLIGISFANSITYPISLLMNGAEKISKGNLKFRISDDSFKNNELYNLINRFNRMIKQLYDQRKDLVTANEQIDNRRRFTESVLTGVKSGVLGVGSDDFIYLANKSALELLEVDASKLVGNNINDLFPSLKTFIKDIKDTKINFKEKQIEHYVKGKKKIFIVGLSYEPYQKVENSYVVTIEDITQLIQTQRTAAWSDIAKIIAHEIKNPLTPIQLSAERLKYKYLDNIEKDKEVFANCIDTIIRQVSTMHRMVNEFSTFAQMPRAIFENININKIIKGNIGMTKLANKDILIDSNTTKVQDLNIRLDPNLLNQAFNNLIKNSINAIREKRIKNSKLRGKIFIEIDKKEGYFFLKVTDNGIGFPKDKEFLTEPYISRSNKGSGLGLAIVKKIMQDHKGSIELNNNIDNSGANVTLIFPIDLN